MDAILLNRRSETILAAWEGTGEGGPFVRRAAFTLLNFHQDEFPSAERNQMGTSLAPSCHAAVQTDLSVEQFLAKAEAVAAAAAAEAAERPTGRRARPSGARRRRRACRRSCRRSARRAWWWWTTKEGQAAERPPVRRQLRVLLRRQEGPPRQHGAAQAHPVVAQLFAAKVAADDEARRLGRPLVPMPTFLCAHYLRESGLRSKARKHLAMLLHGAAARAEQRARQARRPARLLVRGANERAGLPRGGRAVRRVGAGQAPHGAAGGAAAGAPDARRGRRGTPLGGPVGFKDGEASSARGARSRSWWKGPSCRSTSRPR